MKDILKTAIFSPVKPTRNESLLQFTLSIPFALVCVALITNMNYQIFPTISNNILVYFILLGVLLIYTLLDLIIRCKRNVEMKRSFDTQRKEWIIHFVFWGILIAAGFAFICFGLYRPDSYILS